MPTASRTASTFALAALAALVLLALGAVASADTAKTASGDDDAASPAVFAGPEPRSAFLATVDPADNATGTTARSPDTAVPSSPEEAWTLEASSAPSPSAFVADAKAASGCVPHPPISITEEVGEQGFVLGHDPVTGEPVYRPGSGVVAGSGTAEDPYVIEGWCIEAPGNVQGIPMCIIVPGVERWCGDVPNDLVAAPDAAVSIEGTDAHVVVRDNVVTGSTVAVNVLLPQASGVVLDEAANVTVAGNVAALTASGVAVIDSQDVDVRQNTLAYALSTGVASSRSQAVTIADNEALLTWRGVWLHDAGNETVVEANTVRDATVEGIRVQHSEGLLLRDNVVDGAGGNLALRLDESTDLRLAGNELVGGGLAMTGEVLDHYVHDVDDGNLVNGEPLVYLHQANGVRVEEPVGQLVVVDAAGVKAEGIHVADAAYGIHAIETHGLHVDEVLVEDTRNGIVLEDTTATHVRDSRVHGAAPAPGIFVDGGASTQLVGNEVTASGFDAGFLASGGIVVAGADETRLADNEAVANEGFGIGVWGGASDTELAGDEARRNALHGIIVGDSRATDVQEATAASNEGFGVDVRGTETTIDEATIEANADGGLRMYNAEDANVTRSRIVDNARSDVLGDVEGDVDAGVEVWETTGALLEANTVSGHANGTALYGANENVSLRGNDITGNEIGVWVEASFVGQPENIELTRNDIEANTDRGLHAQNLAQPLDARENWWGHASGPSGHVVDDCTGTLADGDGDRISTNGAGVCFEPWLEAAWRR